ncbi:hypothetical protein ACVIGA_008793 [Bradyrhizobium sp. USDA 3240]
MIVANDFAAALVGLAPSRRHSKIVKPRVQHNPAGIHLIFAGRCPNNRDQLCSQVIPEPRWSRSGVHQYRLLLRRANGPARLFSKPIAVTACVDQRRWMKQAIKNPAEQLQ